jgi:hypothetical protein
VTLAEHYSIRQDEHVDDVTWLADSAARGWVALGKDQRIRRRPAEKAAVRRDGARGFYRPAATGPARSMSSGSWPTSRPSRARVPRSGRSST